MANNINRRYWLKQTALVMAGLGLRPHLSFAHNPQIVNRSSSLILLNANENPYGPSLQTKEAMVTALRTSNRYPDDLLPDLHEKIAAHWGVSTENILLGAGSSEIIGLACLHVSKNKGHILSAEPAYKEWNDQASAFGLSIRQLPFPRDGGVNVDKLFQPITGETRMIYICNPNNPTGSVMNVADVKDFALRAASKTMVFIDEAYAEFAALPSLASVAATNKNIIVAKTFSKIYGLAGARLGYAIAHPETITTLSRYQPWPEANVSRVSVMAASAALADQAFVQDCRTKIASTREQCAEAIKAKGWECFTSSANFILFNINRVKPLFEKAMNEAHIRVQYRRHYNEDWCRVTMGTGEEMKAFGAVLQRI